MLLSKHHVYTCIDQCCIFIFFPFETRCVPMNNFSSLSVYLVYEVWWWWCILGTSYIDGTKTIVGCGVGLFFFYSVVVKDESIVAMFWYLDRLSWGEFTRSSTQFSSIALFRFPHVQSFSHDWYKEGQVWFKTLMSKLGW